MAPTVKRPIYKAAKALFEEGGFSKKSYAEQFLTANRDRLLEAVKDDSAEFQPGNVLAYLPTARANHMAYYGELFAYNRRLLLTLKDLTEHVYKGSPEQLVELLNYPHQRDGQGFLLHTLPSQDAGSVIVDFIEAYSSELVGLALKAAEREAGETLVKKVKSEIIGYKEPARSARK